MPGGKGSDRDRTCLRCRSRGQLLKENRKAPVLPLEGMAQRRRGLPNSRFHVGGAGDPQGLKVSKKLFEHDAETRLATALASARDKVEPMHASRSYAEVLNTLADLREPVDLFFDDVMVMTDDEAVRNNRLALLAELRALFLDVADISRLSLG